MELRNPLQRLSLQAGTAAAAAGAAAAGVDDPIPPSAGGQHEMFIELKNRASLLSRERAEQLENVVGGQVLIRDWQNTYEELLENEVEMNLKAQFPIFFSALSYTTDWRYRLVSLVSFIWFILSFYISLSTCITNTSVGLTVSTSPFLMFCTTCNTLANPWIFTGSAFNGKITTAKITKRDPAASGYFRILEAQLTLIRKLGGGGAEGPAQMPKEGLGFKLALNLIPLAVAVQCILICVFVNSYWSLFVDFMGTMSPSADCTIPKSFQQASGYLLAPFLNAALSMYACVVSLCGLAVGSSVCGSMTASWCQRYEAVKYLHESALVPSGVKKHELRADAYERYFLVRHFFSESSKVWDHYLCIYILAAFIVFFYSTVVVYLEAHSNIGASQSVWQVLSFVAFVVPLYLVSTANAYTQSIQDMFRFSVPPVLPPGCECQGNNYRTGFGTGSGNVNGSGSGSRDRSGTQQTQGSRQSLGGEAVADGNFSVIGGRNEWLWFVTDSPVYWKVLGLPVTSERLVTVVLGTAVSLLATILPRLLNRLPPS